MSILIPFILDAMSRSNKITFRDTKSARESIKTPITPNDSTKRAVAKKIVSPYRSPSTLFKRAFKY